MMNKKEKSTIEKISDPEEYFEKSGVNNAIRDVISLLVENRPKDPIAFLSQHFGSLVEEVSVIVRAQRLVCLTHHSRPAFSDNVISAYKILRDKGLTGKLHNELLKGLCNGLPPVIAERLLEKLNCKELDAVPHQLFYNNVLTCLVCHDYKKHSELLYRELGSVCDRGVCEALFQLLAEHTESSNKYELSSSLIARAISSANNYGQQFISSEEFVISALDTYVDMLQTPP